MVTLFININDSNLYQSCFYILSCEVAALPFQAHANYWSMDFAFWVHQYHLSNIAIAILDFSLLLPL